MPFNGSGTFVRAYNWVNDANSSIPITASRMDADSNDFASGLTNCVTRDGQGVFGANINANGFSLTNLGAGTNIAPSIAFISDAATGFFHSAAGIVGLAGALTVSGALTLGGGATIGGATTITGLLTASGSLAYTPQGSGAVATTVAARLNQTWVFDAAWGADPTGATDMSTAIGNAVTALSTAGGGELLFPVGTYLWASATALTVPANITLRGVGRYASKITTNNSGANIFNLNGAGASIRGLGFQSSTTQTSGTYILVSGSENCVEDFHISNDYNGIKVTGVATKIGRGWWGPGASGGKRIIMLCGDASPKLFDMLWEAQTAPFPSAGLSLQNCTAMTATNLDILTQGNGLEIIPGTGQLCLSNNFFGCFFDTCATPVLIQPSGTGVVARTTFTTCWSGDGTGVNSGMQVVQSGSSTIAGLDLINHDASVNNAGGAGVSLNGAVTGVQIIGGRYCNNSTYGIYAGHTGDITVIGAKIGAYDGFSGNGSWGISLSGANTFAVITGCSLIGNGSGAIQNPSVPAIKFIHDNFLPGFSRYGTITVGASPFSYVAPYDMNVYIGGGTVSLVVVGSVAAFTATNSSVFVRQGDTVQVTYTVAPSMNYSA